MATTLDAQSVALGAVIRSLRRERGETLVEVSQRCGLSHPFLSQVERGRARPSFASVDAIARALGTTQFALFALAAGTEAPDPDHPDAARTAQVSDGAARVFQGPFGPFEPVEIVATNSDFKEYFSHSEDELCYLVDGTAWLDLDGEVHLLAAGDAHWIPSSAPHRWRSADGAPFRMLFVKNRPSPQEDA